MLQSILNNYLIIRSRKLQNLISKRNKIVFCLLPLVTQIYSRKNCHIQLWVCSENLDCQIKLYRSKNQSQSYMLNTKKDFLEKSSNIKQHSPPLNLPCLPQSSESQPFPLPILPCPDIPVGGRLALFVEQWGELTQNKWVLSIIRKG